MNTQKSCTFKYKFIKLLFMSQFGLSKREAEEKLYQGLQVYGEHEKRIEFLTISINKSQSRDIMIYFERLCQQMLYQGKYGVIDYFLVNVDGQHIHALIKKPYVRIEELVNSWKRITDDDSHLLIKTVRSDKTKRSKMLKLVNYIITQDEKHNSSVKYRCSENWGVISIKKKEKKEISPLKKIKNKIVYEDSYYINSQILSKDEYDKLQK